MPAEKRSSNRRRIAIGLAATALIAGIAFLALNLRIVEKEVDGGYSEDARRNPFLAAELFLRDQGVEVETVRGLSLLDHLPPTDELLILAGTRRALSKQRLANLIEWIESGGHVVVVARQPYDEEKPETNDALLTHFDIQLIIPEEEEEEGEDEREENEGVVGVPEDLDGSEDGEPGSDEPGDDEPGSEPLASPESEMARRDGQPEVPHDADSADSSETDVITDFSDSDEENEAEGEADPLPECRPELALLDLRNGGDRLALALPSRSLIWSQRGEGFSAYSEFGAQLVHRRFEKGAVTASTSLGIWRNTRIHCHDHAYLLQLLAGEGGNVWLMHDPAIPSLSSLLRANFPLSCAGGLALLLLWALARGLRHGPTDRSEEEPRRQLLEHLEASARFLWRQGLAGPALADLRQDVRTRSGRRRGTRNPTAEESHRLVSEGSGLSPELVEAALSGPAPRRARDFTQLIKTLQSIRRKL